MFSLFSANRKEKLNFELKIKGLESNIRKLQGEICQKEQSDINSYMEWISLVKLDMGIDIMKHILRFPPSARNSILENFTNLFILDRCTLLKIAKDGGFLTDGFKYEDVCHKCGTSKKYHL